MATVTKGSSYYYQNSNGGVSAVVGYESKTRRVCRISFTLDASATDLTVKLYASPGNVDYRNCQIYMAVSEASDAYVNHTGTDGTFLGSWSASGTKTATISGLKLYPNTTYYLWFYHYADSYAWLYVYNSNITLTASGTVESNMDVNMYLSPEGKWYYSGDGINKFNAVVGGTTVATNANDLKYAAIPGTSYSITPIAGTGYHNYNDTVPLTGTYGDSDFSVGLWFAKNQLYLHFGPHGGYPTASGYGVSDTEWIRKDGKNVLGVKYYGDTIILPTAESMGLVKPGYTFSHWATYHDSVGTVGTKTFTAGGSYSASEFQDRYDSSRTVNTYSGVNCCLIAVWVSNEYTYILDPNGGEVSTPTLSVYYPQSFFDDMPYPTWEGRKFTRWYADIGTNGPINLGRAYMYTSELTLYLDAYMDDWSAFNNMRLISCTHYGGWNIESNNGYIQFTMYDSGVGYKPVLTSILGSDLSPGWHNFKMLFDGTKMYGYVDNVLQGTTENFTSGKIGYCRNNSIWIGAEAAESMSVYDSTFPLFPGYIGRVWIGDTYDAQAGNLLAEFPIAVQNVTLYADWTICEYAYVKVDGEWKLGKIYFKHDGNWD